MRKPYKTEIDYKLLTQVDTALTRGKIGCFPVLLNRTALIIYVWMRLYRQEEQDYDTVHNFDEDPWAGIETQGKDSAMNDSLETFTEIQRLSIIPKILEQNNKSRNPFSCVVQNSIH
ncbi:hypothetical protein CHS0354_022980 [Potamilus streckersoni]|uniref:Uncharacterized protein n=1 Tax=Potamilus streckersoni TaxID=2493646 RepID=A0AAE0SAR3_9BIVA|nr:hypothetical protein CHS0354_022980 [Potamilus streckersoni]